MLLPFFVAFVIATYISIIDFYNTHPTIKWSFTYNSFWLYAYGSVFGVAGVALCYLLNEKLLINSIQTNLKIIPDKYIYAILSGISVKSLSNITIYNVNVDGKTFPIGISTIVQLFEPKFIREIDDDNFIEIERFINSVLKKHSKMKLADVHATIHEKLAYRMNKQEVPTFLLSLVETKTTKEAFLLYLTTFGKKIFCHTFNCK